MDVNKDARPMIYGVIEQFFRSNCSRFEAQLYNIWTFREEVRFMMLDVVEYEEMYDVEVGEKLV